MARKPATADNITVGSTVFSSRTGSRSFTVVELEREAAYPDAPPIVWVKGSKGTGTWFAMRELWT
jgi:hypothetical protein